MSVLTNNVIRKLGALAMVAILLLTVPGIGVYPAMAQAQDDSVKGIFGEVVAKDDNSLTIKSKDGEKETTVKLKVDNSTQIRLPGADNPGSIADVTVGSRVAVLAKGNDPAMTALKVMPIAAEPRREHRTMTVIDAKGNIIVAMDDKGQQVEVEVQLQPGIQPGNMKGNIVTFVGTPGDKPNSFKAQLMVSCDDVVRELGAQVQKLETEAKAELDNGVKLQRQQALEQARIIMEDNMQRHLDRISEVIALVPDDNAKSALRNVLNDTLRRHEDERSKVGRSSVHENELELRHQGAVDDIGKIDDKNAITIKSQGGGKVTLKLDDNPQIRKGKGQGSLSDIAKGASVTVKVDDRTGLVKEVRIENEAEIKGTVQNFDKTTGSLTVALPDGSTQTVKVAAGAVLDVQGQADPLSGLKPGAMVEVKSNTETMEANRVEVKTRDQAKGAIKDINAAAGTATIVTPAGVEIKIKLDDTTRVSVKGLLMGAQALQPGREVEIEFEPGSGKAIRVTDRSGRSGSDRGPSFAEVSRKSGGRFESEVAGTVKNVELATAPATAATSSSGSNGSRGGTSSAGGADDRGGRAAETGEDKGATRTPGTTGAPGATSTPSANSSPGAGILNFFLKIMGVGTATAQTASTPAATGTPKPASSPDDKGSRATETGDDRGGSSRGGNVGSSSGGGSGSSTSGSSGSSGGGSGFAGKLAIIMGNGDTLNLIITPNTRIETQKGALVNGAMVQVRFNSATMEANRVEVNPQAKPEGEVFGAVNSLDAALAASAAKLAVTPGSSTSSPGATSSPAGLDDRGGRAAEAGDDRGATRTPGTTGAPGATSAPTATSSPGAGILNFFLKIMGVGTATAQTTTTPAATGTPKPASSPDDRGGRAAEAGDDRGGSRSSSASGGASTSSSSESGGSGLSGKLSVILGNGDIMNLMAVPGTRINTEKGALQVGAMVQVKFSTTTMEATVVKVNPEVAPDEPTGTTMRGKVSVLNMVLKDMMVTPTTGDPMTFFLKPTSIINTEHGPLQVGANVEVKFKPETLEVIRIEVNPSAVVVPGVVGPSGSPDDKGGRASEVGDDRGGDRGGGGGDSGSSGGSGGGGGSGSGK